MRAVNKQRQPNGQTHAETGSSPALYQRVADTIRGQIREGRLVPGQRLPAFPELCRQYGVSNITIRGAIRSLSEEGLIVREERKGVFIAGGGNAARKPSTGVIGCHGFHHAMRHLPYYFHIFNGLQRGVGQAGYEMLILDSDDPSISWEKIDAVVMVGPSEEALMERLPPGMCAVSLLYPKSAFPTILSDDYAGMRQAVSHLWQHGHRKIAYLHEEDQLTAHRLRGYREELAARGAATLPSWERQMVPHHEEEFRGRGRESMRLWLQDGWAETGCTGLICQNDRTAVGVLEAFREAGVRVPDDVSVVGFDSTDECNLVTPRLTSVKVPLEDMGEKAIEVLFALMKDQAAGTAHPRDVIMLPTEIESRESVRHLP